MRYKFQNDIYKNVGHKNKCVKDVFYRDEDWQDNDGALNTISMTHPRFPIEHPNQFVEKDSDCEPLQPGIWYVVHHLNCVRSNSTYWYNPSCIIFMV